MTAPGRGRAAEVAAVQEAQRFQETGPLWNAIAGAAQLVESEPGQAEETLLKLLEFAPGQPQILQLLADSRRARGDLEGAREILALLSRELPGVAAIHFELGALLADLGETNAAVRALSRVVELEPKHPQAWRALGDVLVKTGHTEGAARAYGRQFQSSILDLKMLEQVAAPEFGHNDLTEDVLQEFLGIYPTDLSALQTLGAHYMRITAFELAEEIFRRATEVAPSFATARLNYINALNHQLRFEEVIAQVDLLLREYPNEAEYRGMKASALSAAGKAEEAIAYCERIIAGDSGNPQYWRIYADALRAGGRQDDCIAAYRKSLELDPQAASAWWGLANLKTFRFSDSDLAAIRGELARENVTEEHRAYLHFALGQALEDHRSYGESFEQYRAGNALIRAGNPYNVGEMIEHAERRKRRFTAEFFATHRNLGCPSEEPIFILGLPRSGSTLVEQILASHSNVEGGGELPSLIAALRPFEAQHFEEADRDTPRAFASDELNALGEEYLKRTAAYRKLSRPHFTDKMPANFRHIGLICAMLPNAKIIDARRHPLACCFSNFKQIFPFRQGPSYDLVDMGRYYRAYVELLAHFDALLPGRIHRVIYEDLVENPEREIRRLLDYCGLPFEESCLRFYETDRGIRTISSEQVRQPLYKSAVEKWRNFEPWLDPLKAALGPALHTYSAGRASA